jgi:GNAT superfamily N-acetyltransferase
VNPDIRPGCPADTDQLLSLIRQHAEFERAVPTIQAPQLRRLLASRQQDPQLFVASLEGRLIGYAALTFDFSLWRASRWAHLDCLFVSADSRQAGIGKRLVESVVSAARIARADRLEWQTPEWNRDAVQFYRRLGARDEGKVRFVIDLTIAHSVELPS